MSRAVARMALQWKGKVACKEDTKKGTWLFGAGEEGGGRTVITERPGGYGTMQGWTSRGQ